MMDEETLAGNVIDSLNQVGDLDLAHQLLCNDLTDRAAPWFGVWMVALMNTERQARDPMNDGGKSDYTMVNLSELPLHDLRAGHAACIGSLKASYGMNCETTVQFIFRVLEMFIAEMHLRLAQAAHLGLLEVENHE